MSRVDPTSWLAHLSICIAAIDVIGCFLDNHQPFSRERQMKRCIIGGVFLVVTFGVVLTSGQTASAQKGGKGETIKLFNGKDLDGWEGYTDLFSVKDGVIVAKNEKPLKVSTYLFTKQKFT